MSDALGDILAGKKFSNEPPEFSVIRSFVKEKFDEPVRLKIKDNSIIIMVDNSALAGSLQFELHELQQKVHKKLRIRVG